MNYIEILRRNKELEVELIKYSPYKISILSNITLNQIKEILECSIRERGVNAKVDFGDYDNIVQDSKNFSSSDCVIVFFEIDNIADNFGYKIELMSNEQIDSIEMKIKTSINFILSNLSKTSTVFFNLFSSLFDESSIQKESQLTSLAKRLNQFLVENAPTNLHLINTNQIKAIGSNRKSLDYRFYNSAKSPYTVEFFKNYSNFVTPVIAALNGKAKKILIFDCDNTLWRGIIGEDGLDGIDMSGKGDGSYFREVQYLVKILQRRGVLIGLCSKNNVHDVDKVLQHHEDMVLRDEDISIKKINWNDKADNLVNIAKELNVGLDSIVFVDDSDFEINNIRQRLPDIETIKVPEKIFQYPSLIRKMSSLFYQESSTDEDLSKASMYRHEQERQESKSSFNNMTEYLQSLKLELNVFIDSKSSFSRIAQLTQKTNQFNLTTKRYSEEDVKKFINNESFSVYTFELADSFGSYGLTGLSIINLKENNAYIDTFLMSCRVIGRNVEINFADYIIMQLKDKGIKKIYASYIKTNKNSQVDNFWERINFNKVRTDKKYVQYELITENYNSIKLDYIKVKKNG
jgi:FkbH-like protein